MSGLEGLYDRKSPFQWISGSSLDLALMSTPVSTSSASPDIALRSAPEVKLPSAPVTIMQRISSFSEASTKASYIRTIIGPDMAFMRFGLFKVTVITWFLISTSASGITQPFNYEYKLILKFLNTGATADKVFITVCSVNPPHRRPILFIFC